jgi:hypothetical protein
MTASPTTAPAAPHQLPHTAPASPSNSEAVRHRVLRRPPSAAPCTGAARPQWPCAGSAGRRRCQRCRGRAPGPCAAGHAATGCRLGRQLQVGAAGGGHARCAALLAKQRHQACGQGGSRCFQRWPCVVLLSSVQYDEQAAGSCWLLERAALGQAALLPAGCCSSPPVPVSVLAQGGGQVARWEAAGGQACRSSTSTRHQASHCQQRAR